MYTAVNGRLIVMMPTAEKETASGIIVVETQEQSPVLRLEVVAFEKDASRFKGKTILAERRLVRELPTASYGSVAIDDIIAVEN